MSSATTASSVECKVSASKSSTCSKKRSRSYEMNLSKVATVAKCLIRSLRERTKHLKQMAKLKIKMRNRRRLRNQTL